MNNLRKIVCFSDSHGHLPKVEPCDLLIIAGDICPTSSHNTDFQEAWLRDVFKPYLENVPAEQVIGIAGNHDFIFENYPELVPEMRWTYLKNSWTYFDKCRHIVYGLPYVTGLSNWAFNLCDDRMQLMTERIPSNTTILVAHSPPMFVGDNIYGGGHCGNKWLYRRLTERELPNLKLIVCGHIHESRGLYMFKDTLIANVSVLNRQYEFVHEPITIYI